MARNQGQLLSDLRESRLDEPTAGQWTDTDLRRYLNEGAVEIARRTECLLATHTQPTVAGTQEYTAPTDAVRIYRVEYIDSSSAVTALEYRDFGNMDAVWWTQKLNTTGRPYLYTMWGYPPTLKIVLYPKPDAIGTLKCYYYKLAVELATSSTADAASSYDIPAGWENILLDYAEYRAYVKDRDPRWAEAKQRFDEHLGAIFETTRRWTDQAGMITEGGSPLAQWIWDEDWVY
jgi:hypothetical protein